MLNTICMQAQSLRTQGLSVLQGLADSLPLIRLSSGLILKDGKEGWQELMPTQSSSTEVDIIAGINYGLSQKSNMMQPQQLAEPG